MIRARDLASRYAVSEHERIEEKIAELGHPGRYRREERSRSNGIEGCPGEGRCLPHVRLVHAQSAAKVWPRPGDWMEAERSCERLRVRVNDDLVLDAGACEGVAAAALVLRWGSYLAVLLDRDKPLWPAAQATGTSALLRAPSLPMARAMLDLDPWILTK